MPLNLNRFLQIGMIEFLYVILGTAIGGVAVVIFQRYYDKWLPSEQPQKEDPKAEELLSKIWDLLQIAISKIEETRNEMCRSSLNYSTHIEPLVIAREDLKVITTNRENLLSAVRFGVGNLNIQGIKITLEMVKNRAGIKDITQARQPTEAAQKILTPLTEAIESCVEALQCRDKYNALIKD